MRQAPPSVERSPSGDFPEFPNLDHLDLSPGGDDGESNGNEDIITDGLEMEYDDEVHVDAGEDSDGAPSDVAVEDLMVMSLLAEDENDGDHADSCPLPAPSSQPILEPSGPMEDVVEEEVREEKGEKDDTHCPRPVARPLNGVDYVNPKSLPHDPRDEADLFGSDDDDDDVQVTHENLVASEPSASSSSTTGHAGARKAKELFALMEQMKALQSKLESLENLK